MMTTSSCRLYVACKTSITIVTVYSKIFIIVIVNFQKLLKLNEWNGIAMSFFEGVIFFVGGGHASSLNIIGELENW